MTILFLSGATVAFIGMLIMPIGAFLDDGRVLFTGLAILFAGLTVAAVSILISIWQYVLQ